MTPHDDRVPPSKGAGRPRDRLLDTAGRLFYRHGFQAVGIDRILAESGVAKMTLYRHFPSKDALIVAYLEHANEEFWSWAESAMSRVEEPEAKLVALFDALARLATSAECLGCVFQGAAVAFPELEHPGHREALRHKLGVRVRLAALARQAGLRAPDALASQLQLLMDGAWVAARMFPPDENPAASVKEAAKDLIEAHHLPQNQAARKLPRRR